MKIIKQGMKLEDRTYRATCSNCNTIYEFLFGEAKKIQKYGDYLQTDCPYCNRRNSTDVNSVWN